MILKPLHKYFAFNGEIVPSDKFGMSDNEGGIYEVVRVMEGIPLFLEEHINRLYHSAELAAITVRFNEQQIENMLYDLINLNQVPNGNLLISCKKDLKAFFISHKYPEVDLFTKGVTCGILLDERTNPNAKILNTSVREEADRKIKEYGYYEVLLVDHHGRVTEGSRSNIFLVKEDTLYTPPGNEVLLGITRKRTIELAQELNIPFVEKDIMLSEINEFKAMFITGTSPKILPVKQAGNVVFDTENRIVFQLIERYNTLINEYINSKKLNA